MTVQISRPPSLDWQDSARCNGVDLVLFFGPEGERAPDREIREKAAKEVCQACPVRADCLSYAVSIPIKYGTWGGLNEDERAEERRRRMRRAGRQPKPEPAPEPEPALRPNGRRNYGKGRCPVCLNQANLTQELRLQSHKDHGARCAGQGRYPVADLKAAS